MDDRQHAVPPASRAKARRLPADGIIGRLTYTPAQGNESIGQIRRNRAKDEIPRFKQVTPFTQWCAPIRTPTSQPSDMRPSQAARSQKYWLLEYLPEALIADEGVESLLLEEIAASQTKTRPVPADTPSLFSVGEVADLRESESKSSKGHPVLAVASGVSGNVLRLISLAREDLVWTQADIRVRLHTANLKLEGEWCRDGVPISLVKFAIDSRKYDPIRWLLVQNGTSTTVYEPELRMIPMPAAKTLARASGRSVGSQFFDNPLFTINCERTGGSLQADVCFARHLEEDIPQLAIIDQAGYWSLWDITGRRNARPKKLTPIMKMCGNTVSGFIPKLPSNSMAKPQPHKVLWLSLGQRGSKPSSRSASHMRSPSEHSRASVELEPQAPRRLLLLYSPKTLHLFDLSAQKLHSVSHLVLPKDAHRIFGVAPSRLGPNQAFILTTTNLLWVVAKEAKNDTLSLDILVSCPHQKDVNDPTLRLDVSPGAYINGLMACFVCVRSAKDTEMAVFWFIDPEPGTPARYHRDLISLKSPANFAGLSILPAGRRMGDEPTSAAGRTMRKAQLRFFQLLTLGQDLDVHSALCAWSDEPGVAVPPPDTKETLEEGGNRRLKLLQILTDAFAVPDEFDERAVFGKKGLESLSLEILRGGKQQRTDLGLVAQRLTTARDLENGDGEGPMSSTDGVDFDFIAQAVEREKEDDYMPRHSLLNLAASHRTEGGLLQLARDWDAQQEALHRRTGEWLFAPEARRPLIDFGPDDLVEKLRDVFLESQPSKDDPSRRSRETVLQNMAAEMFLSNIGVSAVPQSWTTTENQPSSSLPFPSSPSLTSSQPSLPSSRKGRGRAKGEEPEEQGDAATLRLRKYATLDTSPTIHGEPTLALSRWDLGADPDDNTWRPGQDLEAEDAINRRRRKTEARRRKAERLSQRIFGEDSFMTDQSSQSLGGPSTQPLPTILSTGASSQSQPQSQTQSQSQSQSQQQMGPPWDFSSQQQQQQQQQAGGFGSPRVFAGSPLRREFRRDSGIRGPAGVFSSQLASRSQTRLQGTPSQPKSQVMPGLFGGRPSFSPFKRSPLKKGKRKSELRMSGFR
ncbi:RNA polymerase I-specific transcription initiation factor RRN6-like protein [Chaetomidium leptoderma]|uniref:RNA polymerase I-specific transcription initiation factor RRN6-like protein n=1 Tax=Chaetomidium leptoderma TaxID=669021 RepID=A0AAN6VWK7_9PEZI|nr:RNA polymerase I-specific transcription initiation factor RRN6-like protein [Chaetomidium leptoderma]